MTSAGVTSKAVTRRLTGAGVYSHIHALFDRFVFKLINLSFIQKEISRDELEYMNIHLPQLAFYSYSPGNLKNLALL